MRAHRSLVNRSATFPTTVRLLAAAAVTLLASACTTVNVDMPPLAVQVPGQFGSVDPATAQGSADIAQWWKQLDDPVLSGYIEEGLRQNVDVRIALARIKEARAFHGMAESAYYPTVELAAGAGRSRESGAVPTQLGGSAIPGWPGNIPIPLPGNVTPNFPQNASMPLGNTHAYGLAATWEVDIFGARHADAEMVHQLILGAHEQQHGAQLMVAADIATRYFEARGVEKRMRIVERAIYVAERGVKYARGRFQSGQTEAADVARAEMYLRDAQSKVEPLKALLASHLRRIAVLMGQTPQSLPELPPQPPGAQRPPSLPAVLPGDVLARRPDVRGVERKVRSQAAKVGSARAELFPKFYIGLGASAGRA
ncbi:MAG: TolC family protein, partial [Aquabacterium sp.]